MNVQAEIVMLQVALLETTQILEQMVTTSGINADTVRMLADIVRDHTERIEHLLDIVSVHTQALDKVTRNQEKFLEVVRSLEARIKLLEAGQDSIRKDMEYQDNNLRDSIQELRP